MSNYYRDTLESLENGSWPILMRHHIVLDAEQGSKGAKNAIRLGDLLWERLYQRSRDRSRVIQAEKEINDLRDTIQKLTDYLLILENKKLLVTK